MANVPNSDEVPLEGLRQTRDVVSPPKSPLTPAIGEAADAATEVVNRLQDQQNSLDVNRADMASTMALEQIRQKFENDDDWQTAPQRALTEATQTMQQAGGGLQGAATRRAWMEHTSQTLSRFDGVMQNQSRQRGTDLARANIITSGAQARDVAADLSQPQEIRDKAQTGWAAIVQAGVDNGLIHPDDAAQMVVTQTNEVRAKVAGALEAEVVQRMNLDPDHLAAEIEANHGDWATLDPDTRARFLRQAQESGANMAVEHALLATVRTGAITSDEDPALAGRWQYLSDNARLGYAEHAAAALRTYNAASAMGDLAGKSLPEIAAMADEAERAGVTGGGTGNPYLGAAARTHLRAARDDPASYVMSTQPYVAYLAQQYTTLSTQAAAELTAARAHAQTPQQRDAAENSPLQAQALEARVAYANAMLAAQAALGMPPSRQALYPRAVLQAWATRVRAMSPADQAAYVQNSLPTQLDNTWGAMGSDNREIWEKAYREHIDALNAADQPPDQAPPPEPADRAAQGASFDSVKGSLLRLLNAGADLDAPGVTGMVNALSPADRRRLMADPDVLRASGAQQDGQ